MKFGCHVSIAGGVDQAPARAADLGCEVFQIFTRSPQGGKAPEITSELTANFRAEMNKYAMSECIVHTPYYINYGSANNRIFYGTVSVVRQELERASVLGAPFVVTHLGSYKDLGKTKGFAQLIAGLEKTLKGYKGSAKLLLENAAGAGEVIGDDFSELAAIIKHKKLTKFNLGVCIDSCHAFASGYDLRTEKAAGEALRQIDEKIGIKNIFAVHINDSKTDLNSHRDRHEHLGKGKIGLEGIAALIAHPKLQKLNFYLETEHDLVKEDIEILKSMRSQNRKI